MGGAALGLGAHAEGFRSHVAEGARVGQPGQPFLAEGIGHHGAGGEAAQPGRFARVGGVVVRGQRDGCAVRDPGEEDAGVADVGDGECCRG